VLVDMRRYSRHFRLVAEETAAKGVPLVMITDPYCPWARDLTPHVLTAATDFELLWDSYGPLQSMVSLLLDSVTREVGDVSERLRQVSELRQKLVGFAGREPAGVRQQNRERAEVKGRSEAE
jgi:DNA-binding MurR/RpiR family transcriptional regulator